MLISIVLRAIRNFQWLSQRNQAFSVSSASDSGSLSETSEIIKAALEDNVTGITQVLSVFIVKPGEIRLNIVIVQVVPPHFQQRKTWRKVSKIFNECR
jgi:hypothetical protein